MSWIRSERASVAEEAVLRLSIEQGCMFNEDQLLCCLGHKKAQFLPWIGNFEHLCQFYFDM